MSDAVEAGSQGNDPGGAAGSLHSAGTLLRLAREASGLHIGALAVSLKVPVRKLEALEADRYDELPDTVFVRALAASVCKSLKLDPAAVLARLPGHVPRPLSLASRVQHGSFSAPGNGWFEPALARIGRPAVVVAALLIAATIAVLFVPGLSGGKSGTVAVPATTATTVALPDKVVAVAVDQLTAAVAAVASGAVAASEPGSSPPSASLGVVLASAAMPLPAASAAPATVVFKARAPSWLEVVDAGGIVQVRKTLAGGETAEVSGKVPLSVVVGRADVIEVAVRGQAFDLAAVSRDNVARFQVK